MIDRIGERFMPDDGFLGLALAAVADILLDKGAQRHRWVRIVKVIGVLVIFGMILSLVYVTVKYS